MQESKGRERWHADPKREFEERVTKANQAIGQFVNNVQTNANAFLHKYFLGDNNSLSVTLRYQGQLSFDLFRAAPDTAVEREWRNENDDLRIILSVEIRKPDKPPVTHFRPQSFLNEAQLTRIALAVRLGALLTRVQNSEMKLLCLDDLLISLDMVNRKHVLDWLFGEGGRYCREYQIICLTHDRELYRMLRHYIAKPEAGQWKIFELVNNEYYPTPQPSVLDGGSNDHLSQAWRRFYDQDYPACANYLRKETERLLKEILPPADIYQLPSNDGESVPIPLGTQIEKLKTLYKKHEGAWDKLDDLKLFKEVLLNPLSHDSFSTTVYQNELHELLTVIIPTLRKVTRQAVKELDKDQATLIYLTAVASSGTSYTYTIQLHESLWQFTFQDGQTAYSHPACQVLSRKDEDGKQEDFDEGAGSCVDLEDAFRKIRYALGAAPAPGEKKVSIAEQPLHDIVSITAE